MGKIHYKMYKEGKLWVVAGIASLTFGVGIGYSVTEAHADTSVDSVATQTDSGTNSAITNSSVALQVTSAATNNQQTSTVSSHAGTSSTTSTASSKANNAQASSNTTSNEVATSQNSDATSTANSGVSTNKALSVNSKASQIQEATSSQNPKTAIAQAVVAPMSSASALAVSDPDTTYTAKITLWNDTTNKPYTGYGVPYASVLDPTTGDYTYTDRTGNTEVYDPSTSEYTFEGPEGTKINDFTYPVPGYKLLNPETLKDNLIVGTLDPWMPALINWQMPNHDVEFTLHFAELALLQVNYIDKDTNKYILITMLPTSWGVPDSGEYLSGNPMAISASKYTVEALNIPGYKLVSAPDISGVTNQVSTTNQPYVQLNFYYQVTNPTVAASVMPNGVGQIIGLQWPSMPGVFTIKGVYGEKISDENGDVNAKIAALIEKYASQGFAFGGIVGTHANDDYFNYCQIGIWLHFLPNQNVTVDYVDENGKSLSKSLILASNTNNPDQQNSGIDPSNYWNPAGTWTATALKLNEYGYELDTTKNPAMVEGEFAPFTQTVTFVYKHILKTVTPENPGIPGQPIDPTQPNGPKYPDGTERNNLVNEVIRTINYVDKQTGKSVAPTVTQTVDYQRTATIDEVTGDVMYTDWILTTPIDTLDSVTSPDLSQEGYGTPDQAVVEAEKIPESYNGNKNINVIIKYAQLVVPSKPVRRISPALLISQVYPIHLLIRAHQIYQTN